LLDEEGVGGNVVTPEAAEYVKNFYENYVPLSRVMPDDLEKISISGGIRNSVGRQNIIQSIEGGSAPLSDSFESAVSRINAIVKQAATNRFDNEILRRVQNGTMEGRVIIDADVTAAKREFDNLHKELLGVRNDLNKGKAKVTGKLRVQGVKTAQAEKEVVAKSREALRKVVDDPDAKAAIGDLKKDDFITIFKGMVEDGAPGLERLRKNLIRQGGKKQALADELYDMKAKIDDVSGDIQMAWDNKTALIQEKGTNLNFIQGQKNGELFKVEIPPDLAQGLASLSANKSKDVAISLLNVPATVAKTLYTGALNPVFSIINGLVKNPVLMVHNARRLTPFGLRAIAQGIAGLKGNNKFVTMLRENGYTPVRSTAVAGDYQATAQMIASRGGIGNYLNLWAKSPGLAAKDAFRTLDIVAAKLDNMQRVQIGAGAYYNALRRGIPETQAQEIAARAANEVLGDFNRVTQLARGLEPILLYSGATQAGIRSTLRAYKVRPFETTMKTAALATGLGTAVAHRLSTDEGEAFTKDMQASGKQYVLDNNIVIVTPLAHKDEKTGEWTGVIKIPIAPDFRAINRMVGNAQQQLHDGNGVDPKVAAGNLFDYVTGGVRQSVYDPNSGGLLGSNPVVQTGKTLVGLDPRTNEPLANEDLANKPKGEQAYESTTDFAKKLAGLTGNRISPIQADKLLGSMGLLGQTLQNREGDPASNTLAAVKRQFSGAYGKSAGSQFYDELDSVTKSIKNDKDRALFKSLHKKDDREGMLNGATKAAIYLSNPEVFEADKRLDAFNRKRGKAGNPLYDLNPEQRNAVLTYRQGKIYNSAGQNRDKNDQTAFTALGLDEKWYEDFKAKESAFYAGLALGDDDEKGAKTFSGAVKPQADDALQAKLDYYYTLSKGTGDRSRFLRANPDVLGYWAQQNDFTNEERTALGFKPLEDDSSGGYAYGGKKYYTDKDGNITTEDPTRKNSYFSELTPGKLDLSSPNVPNTKPKVTPFKLKIPKRPANNKRLRLRV
jgi:hypothetical protein